MSKSLEVAAVKATVCGRGVLTRGGASDDSEDGQDTGVRATMELAQSRYLDG